MIETPADAGGDDALSSVLRSIRLSGSLQFCVVSAGVWETDGKPRMAALAGSSSVMPFHIVAEGTCWLEMDGARRQLSTGDVVVFPFLTGHKLGVGSGGRQIAPIADLPPKPWRAVPVLTYGKGRTRVRLLCGWLTCDAMGFRPLREALPRLIHVSTQGNGRRGAETAWLRATIAQMIAEVDRPRAGGLSVLERLSEISFIELLRLQIIAARPAAIGWLAALADAPLRRCLALIHDDPGRAWSVATLAAASGLSRSTLTERFETVLESAPMRYVREWRLYLASVALGTTGRPIAAIADEAGYGTEAAFNRAFARAYSTPPAAWRRAARRR